MNLLDKSARVLAVCCVCTALSAAVNAEEPDMSEPAGVTVEITALDVNDVAIPYEGPCQVEGGWHPQDAT